MKGFFPLLIVFKLNYLCTGKKAPQDCLIIIRSAGEKAGPLSDLNAIRINPTF